MNERERALQVHPSAGILGTVIPFPHGKTVTPKRRTGDGRPVVINLAAARNKNFKARKAKKINRIICWFCRTEEHDRCLDVDYDVVCICEKCHPERGRDDAVFSGNFKPRVERKNYTAKQVARELEIDPKAFRKFLRSPYSPIKAAGQGGTYTISRDDLNKVYWAYDGYKKRKEAAKYRRERSTPQADDPES